MGVFFPLPASLTQALKSFWQQFTAGFAIPSYWETRSRWRLLNSSLPAKQNLSISRSKREISGHIRRPDAASSRISRGSCPFEGESVACCRGAYFSARKGRCPRRGSGAEGLRGARGSSRRGAHPAAFPASPGVSRDAVSGVVGASAALRVSSTDGTPFDVVSRN